MTTELLEQPNAIHLDFEDTAAAFADKQDWELKRRYFLLRLMSWPRITNFLSKFTEGLLKLRLPISWFIRKTIFAEFCGGETLESCLDTVKKLSRRNIQSILDHAIEAQLDDQAFQNTTDEVIRAIELTQDNSNVAFAVFKVTAIARKDLLEKLSAGEPLSDGERAEWERAKARLIQICDSAQSAGKSVLIDGEETWIQNAIDDVATELMERYNSENPVIFNTIQLYRTDRLEFLKTSHDIAVRHGYLLGAKIVRGAYMEKERERASALGYPSPIHPTREETDIAYNQGLTYCVENVESLAFCVGSHNQESFELLVSLMEKNNIAPNHRHVVCAQLFGMGDNLSYGLAKNGFNVAKLVPYGTVPEALPYLIRRAKENKSVIGQIGRELRIAQKEVQRRGLQN